MVQTVFTGTMICGIEVMVFFHVSIFVSLRGMPRYVLTSHKPTRKNNKTTGLIGAGTVLGLSN